MDQWETPSFIEVDMSAEIGGYQGEVPNDGPDYPPFPDFAENTPAAV